MIVATTLRRFPRISMVSRAYTTAKRNLDGKVAVVTAASEGIGFAIAQRLLQDGAKVMLSSRKIAKVEKALDALTKSGITSNHVRGMSCHVGNKADRVAMIDKTVSEFGGIDIVVSNAATNPFMGPTLECPEAMWDKIFEINVKTAFLLAQEVYPHLQKSKDASITFISSIAGFQPFQLLGPYSVSKTALLGLTKVLAQQLGPEGIRVNCIAPGVIKTNFSSALTASPEIVDKMLEQIPAGRIGNPEDVAGLVSFLSSKDASYITGESFVVAGGQASRL